VPPTESQRRDLFEVLEVTQLTRGSRSGVTGEWGDL